jgi:hypothetical protein
MFDGVITDNPQEIRMLLHLITNNTNEMKKTSNSYYDNLMEKLIETKEEAVSFQLKIV